ncbi:sulfurtransferase [Phragmitibacter flavus]|uniref:tRNA uridine(34) hydroxylase n=1 Tax=Phragmitibacter flavus TaxID=2576071 RepID=A0A5R8KA93_9BACT|nr:sulfurtransferase [Phragmitibacter flavus]TLD69242.1 sulfurtransferase [Phragmitibacter flavus]
MPSFTNIAAYLFANLTDLKSLRESLLADCKTWNLKGTILLAPEGINLFIAGSAENIENLLTRLRDIPGLETLSPKYSLSDHQPFNRMLVRLKKEIISFGVEGINPAQRTSPKLSPKQLKAWLDEGKPVTLLDTRNDYEVKLGTFKNAHILPIDHFREFPEAVRQLPEELKHQPIVMFCTGGIRCEKAGPFMEREGFTDIHQLDGGILKYFEDCGGDHYDGECFVFDQRVGVDPALRETSSAVCFACQSPLTEEEHSDPRYIPGQSCPYCYRTSEQQLTETLAASRARLADLLSKPLPGSTPYDNSRPLNIPESCDSLPFVDALVTIFPHISRDEWRRLCAEDAFLDTNGHPVAADHIVHAGERYVRMQRNLTEPDINAAIELLYEDEAILVINKPAPLPMHPAGRFNRNTLQHLLNLAYDPRKIRAAHRLDANTTGLVICTLTRHFANLLQPQFERGEVEKIYLTRVQGHPPTDHFFSDQPISDEPGLAGSRTIDHLNGLPARTEFTVISRDPDGTALLEARPITGRTNQIRVHLWHLGFPIVGDQAYLPNHQNGPTQTLDTEAPPLCLHASRMTFTHPLTQQRQTFEAPRPMWA